MAATNVTPLDRVETLRSSIEVLGNEADEIIQLALNEQRELTEEEDARLTEIVGTNRDGKDEACLVAKITLDLNRWEAVNNGVRKRELERANTTPPPPNRDDLSVITSARRDFPMGCNRSVIIATENRRGHRLLEKFGNAWGENRREREENAYAAGMWFLAHIYSQHPEARTKPIVTKAIAWCRDHGILNQQDTVTATKGPELVPAPLESAIIEIREMFGVMRRFSRIYPMSSKTLDIPKFAGGLTVGLVVELAAQLITEKTWSQINLIAKKAGGFAQWSTEIGEDAIISLAADLARDFGIAFAFREDTTGFTGDGVADFANMGITGIIDSLADGSRHTLGTGGVTYDQFALSDGSAMLGLVPNIAGINLHWFMHKTVYYAAIHPLKTAAGGNTIATLSDGDPLTTGSDFRFLGTEGTFTNVLPDVAGEAVNQEGGIILGDLNLGVAFGDRRGVTVQVSEHIKIIEDAVVMTANSRFDIQTHDVGTASVAGVIVMLRLAAV